MSRNKGKTVAEILKGKKASIRQAPLEPGSPSWDDIMNLTWEELVRRKKRRERGFKTFHKLLTKGEYNR